MKLTLIGAGAYGTALASILKYNGHEVKFYDPYKYPKITLADALSATEAIVFCAPSSTFAETAKDLPKDLPLIIASKGFFSTNQFTNFSDFAVLSGAAFADDILNETPPFGDQIALTATSHLCETLFSTEYVKIEYTTDAHAVLLCGTLKNIYAIYIGHTSKTAISDKTANKDANKDLYAHIFHELEDILFENDSDPSVARLSCGLPDLILSSSPDSRNFAFGQILAEADSSAVSFLEKNTVEGYNAINSPDFKTLNIPTTAKILRKTIDLVKSINPKELNYAAK